MTLRIDAGDLLLAMDSSDLDFDNYLDLQTGDVIPDLDGGFGPGDPEYEQLQGIRDDDVTRFRRIERVESRQGWLWMEEFADGVADPRIRERLLGAIEGRGAFGRFKRALLDHPELREEWFRFEEARMLEHAREWLHGEGIEAELVGLPGTSAERPAP